jgi:acetyl esterase/lipase
MKHRAFTPLLVPCLAFSSLFAQQTVIPLWPHGTPEPPQTSEAEVDVTKPTDALISGHRSARITNVTNPTMTVYTPPGKSLDAHAAALVFPGGAYIRLAWDGEGTDTCKWLTSLGVTCVLVKYRVPEQGRYPETYADLEDAQQAMRITRAHSTEWHIDPQKIGVVGFSAGGNLAVLMSTHSDDPHVESTPAASEVDTKVSAKADFAIVVYPAYLGVEPAKKELDPKYTPNSLTPPTFMIQAENDRFYGPNSLLYYRALMDAKVAAELHLYPTGGHGFGMHPVGFPEEHWSQTAAAWLHLIGMLPEPVNQSTSSLPAADSNGLPVQICPAPQTLGPTHPTRPDLSSEDNPSCW